MKKIFAITFVLAVMLCSVGCQIRDKYKFLQDVSEIETIKIVTIGEYQEEEDMVSMTPVCIIEDIEAFLTDFLEMNCYNNWGGSTRCYGTF